MKKTLSILIMTIFLLTTLAGCSSNSKSPAEPNHQEGSKFPEKPIELIVPFSAGGATDALARSLAKEASNFLPNNQNIVIVNKPGAGATMGVTDVFKAKADGYTIGMAYTSSFTQSPYIISDVKYDHTDFDYLMTATSTLTYIQVLQDSKIKTWEDFVAITKGGDMKPTIGVMGIGGPGHLGMEQFADKYGMTNFTIVPYKSATEAWQGLQQKSVDVNFVSVDQEATNVNILAGAADEKSAFFPDVPTIKEHGYDINNVDVLTVLFLRKEVPDDVKDILFEALSEAAKTDAFKKVAEQFSTENAYKDTSAAREYIENEYNWVLPVLKKVGLYVNEPKK